MSAASAPKQNFFCSSIGRKVIMAVTGAALLGFVIAHLLGNLQVFAGPEKFNAYAAFLKGLGPALWVARIGLLVVFLAHIGTAFKLWQLNSAARPKEYESQATVQASAASRYMLQSGMVILIFVIIHLLHFTLGVLEPEKYNLLDAAGRHDVYSMLVLGFQNPLYAGSYIVCLLALGFHLSHACSSMLQTVGLNHPRWAEQIHTGGKALGWLIALGYISIPLGVITGIVAIKG